MILIILFFLVATPALAQDDLKVLEARITYLEHHQAMMAKFIDVQEIRIKDLETRKTIRKIKKVLQTQGAMQP